MNKIFRNVLCGMFFLCSVSVFGQTANHVDAMKGQNRVRVNTSVNVGNIWAERSNANNKVLVTCGNDRMQFVVYPSKEEAWNYICKITVKDFVLPDKKQKKTHSKGDQWYVYDCEVEFFYSAEYPSIEECFAKYGDFIVNAKDEAKKRVVGAKIKLSPDFFMDFKTSLDINAVQTLNLWIDEVGYAIFFRDHLYF